MALTAAQLSAPSFTCTHFTDDAPRQAELAAAGLALADIGAGAIHTDEELFEALARELPFPESFGGSWEEVRACLGGLPADTGHVLILRNAGHMWASHPGIGSNLHAAWSSVAEDRWRNGSPFHLVFEW